MCSAPRESQPTIVADAGLEQDLRHRDAGRADARRRARAGPRASRPSACSALSSAASTTTAVPCWSSWKTGMSSSAFSRSSISKQRGAEMSSRLMPPNAGAIGLDGARRSRPGPSCRGRSGSASTPPNSLNSIALPSITGIAASGPMSPRPSTADAVGDDGDRVALDRVLEGLRAVLARSPGRRAPRRACRPSRGRRACAAACLLRSSILPPTCSAKRAVGGVDHARRRRPRAIASTMRSAVLLVAGVDRDVAHACGRPRPTSRSTEPIVPPASPIAVATRPSIPGRSVDLDADREASTGRSGWVTAASGTYVASASAAARSTGRCSASRLGSSAMAEPTSSS